MPQFKGIIAAIITPFDQDGNLYEPGIDNQIGYLGEKGIDNFFVCGSYGAFPTMTDQQRSRAAELAVKSGKTNNVKIIVQIGSTSTEAAVKLAKKAEEAGADAVAAVVPYYYSTTIYKEEYFLRYYEAIINAVSIPVHCYNNTRTTGFNVSPAFLGQLIDAGLKGIKDVANMERIIEMYKVIDSKNIDFDYYPSSTSNLITGFLLGAQSCISGVSLSVPELVKDIYSQMMNNDVKNAVKLYRKAMAVRAILGKHSGRAIAAYDVLNAKGIDVGTCKAPWQRLTKEQSDWMIAELKVLGVL